MDDFDKKILKCLQEDATISTSALSEKVGLSTTPCWRRVQILEEKGFIEKRVAIVNKKKLNLSLTVIVNIKTSQHSKDWLDCFKKSIVHIPEVVEVLRLSGETDYSLKILVPNIEEYDRVYQEIISKIDDLYDVSSSFVMEEIKSTTKLPLNYI
ncbi:Lrp/AsnC family transcriptional regulator [Emcibacteraceae bacterium]|jgi:Lrp/AsnC family transcriptional regulator|nr:Lrp/AsnC family transcriptional regulator [Kordiimonadaceae bacterium]MDA7568801.1 Lrp/AsnC family transcriptional regulator [Emcibacteraceae bacterium]MDA9553327.1 Lrp/AsnC family transcriptional regulator [Emcibacteraceae bacterium]MDA9770238.1 Lrp/AsnC family transcriptional regulator [Emcibacteraceae bacterium]MDG1021891.1 Lrp/AsnC family transcriptional regulator [Emcibacteraceae bacterium]